MKFLWLLAVVFSAIVLLLVPTALADTAENVDQLQVKSEGEKVQLHESKLLNDVDVNEQSSDDGDDGDDGDGDEALEDDNKQYDELHASMVITNKDVEQIKEPGMQRLARHLQSFHNDNLQRSYNSKVQAADEDDTPQERAVRTRRRIRRRNTINKVKNSSTRRRRKNSRRKSNKNNKVRRRKTKKSKSKKVKKNRRINRRGHYKRGHKRRGGKRRHGMRSGNRKHKRSKSRRNRRNKAQHKEGKYEREQTEDNENELKS